MTINGSGRSMRKKRGGRNWTKIFLFLLFFEVSCFFVFLVYFVRHDEYKRTHNLEHAVSQDTNNKLRALEKLTKRQLINNGSTVVITNRRVKHKRVNNMGETRVTPKPTAKELVPEVQNKDSQGNLGLDVALDLRPDADLAVNVHLKELSQSITGKKTARSCRWYRRSSTKDSSSTLVELDYCSTDPSLKGLVFYNPIDQERLLCGKTLKPLNKVQLETKCKEHSRLFSADPTVSGEGMPPIQINWGKPKTVPYNCSVPCEVQDSYGGIRNTRFIKGTPWKFIFSMEGSHYYPELEIQREAYKEDQYFATTSFQSEVPLPYFSWDEYQIQHPAIDFDKAIKGASFIARNCNSKNDREGLVTELQKHFRVDSLSSCLHNAEPPNGLDLSDKVKLQQQYLFHLAFENGAVDDYITEKLWGSYYSGTLPIYFGAPNVKEHAPPNSIIVVQDFNTTKDLADYLKKVASNKTLYESYHAWRNKDLPESFHRKLDFTHIHSNCRMCRWAFAKKYGFEWNHAKQDVADTAIPRNATLKDGLVSGTFREGWIDTSGGNRAQLNILPEVTEPISPEGSVASIGSTGLVRTVYNHDGVTDLVISQTIPDKDIAHVRLELDTGMKNAKLSGEGQSFRFQDNLSRFTLVTGWNSTVTTSQPGILQVSFGESLPEFSNMRLRVIVESLDKFHDDGENQEYYFGTLMKEDFLKPIEKFYIS